MRSWLESSESSSIPVRSYSVKGSFCSITISTFIGEIEEKTENSLILNCNDMGFEVFVSTNTIVNAGNLGEIAKLFTYLNVKEDEMSLYGFLTKEEKNMFLKLITVSGVGPKLALTVLSGLTLSDLSIAIKSEDIKLLSTIKGLGKKTAERIALELKDKVDVLGCYEETSQPEININMVDEATDALVALGLNKNEAYRLAKLNAVDSETTEDIIRKAFQNLNA